MMFQNIHPNIWYPAEIISHNEEPKSYMIKNNDGILYRRNEKHLCPYVLWWQRKSQLSSNTEKWTPVRQARGPVRCTRDDITLIPMRPIS